MKRRYYIIIAIISYLVFTLAGTPAATVYSLINKNTTMPAKIHGIQGSIWDGQADSIAINTLPPINNITWSLNPFYFLLASLDLDLTAEIKEQKLIGNINLGLTGSITASDLRTQLPAKVVQDLIGMPIGELDGDFNLNIQSLKWSANELPQTEATIKWRNAKLTLAEPVELGHVLIDIKPKQDNALDIKINNQKGALDINGKADVSSDKKFNLDIEFKPGNNASGNIKQSLSMFAKRQSDGSYRFKQTGNLGQYGF